jgi:hypothetical protein
MTTYNIKSTVISNRDATPKVFTDALVDGGRLCATEGYVQTFGSADGAGSIYRMCPVPSGARVEGVKLQAQAMGSGAAINVGVYYPTYIPIGAGLSSSNASAVINTTLFVSALGMSAATAITDVTNSSGNNTIQNQELPLWSACGLASDPMMDLDICVEVSTAIAAQAYIGLKVSYVK